MPDSSVLAANTSDVNSINHHESNSIHANNGVVQPEQHTEGTDAIVYVTGAIQSPGLYKVASSSTIGDVIKGAGGALPYGDVESINLAETVTGGQHIHIKFNFHGNPESLILTRLLLRNSIHCLELDQPWQNGLKSIVKVRALLHL